MINNKYVTAHVGRAHHACGTSADDESFDLHEVQVPRFARICKGWLLTLEYAEPLIVVEIPVLII